MGLFATLKWLWDPRDDAQKAYDAWDETTPLQRHTQHLLIYIKDLRPPFERTITFEDYNIGGLGNIRVDAEDKVNEWLAKCGTNGIKIDSVWYAPEQILRIELGKLETTDIV